MKSFISECKKHRAEKIRPVFFVAAYIIRPISYQNIPWNQLLPLPFINFPPVQKTVYIIYKKCNKAYKN